MAVWEFAELSEDSGCRASLNPKTGKFEVYKVDNDGDYLQFVDLTQKQALKFVQFVAHCFESKCEEQE